MENDLLILVVDRPLGWENYSPIKIFKLFYEKNFDGLVVKTQTSFSFFLVETKNTTKLHIGQWRYILFLNGEECKFQNKKFHYFEMENFSSSMFLNILDKYFNLKTRKEVIV